MAPFPGNQVREANGRGLPGTEVMSTYLRLVAESGYEWPQPYTLD
jgi:C4-dicarboxylate-binding protein DctP